MAKNLDDHITMSPSQRRKERASQSKIKVKSKPDWSRAFGQDQRGWRKDIDKDPVSNTTGWLGNIGRKPFEPGTDDHPIPPTKITLEAITALPPIDNDKGRAIRGRTVHPRLRILQQLIQTEFHQAIDRWHKTVLFEHGERKLELYGSGPRHFFVEHTAMQVKRSVHYDSRASAELHLQIGKIIWAETFDIPPVSD